MTKTFTPEFLEKLVIYSYFFWQCVEIEGMGVNRCGTEGSKYQVTIIYLISLYLIKDRMEVTKLAFRH